MDHLTVVLPFALPPPELASDIVRAMQAPALAALLTRSRHGRRTDFDNASRLLPHEAWLAHALGLAGAPDGADPGAGLAAAVLRGHGQRPEPGCWFLVHPVHVQIARNHLLLTDPRQLALDDAESRALFEAAKPYFDEIGKPLHYGDPHTWFMRADDWAALRCASPDAATGQNLNAWMPEGTSALASRKLQNEVQMLWHEHPVNLARQERGQAPVNAFWLWAGAPAPAPTSPAAPLFVAHAPPWMAGLTEPGRRLDDDACATLLSQPQARALLVDGRLIGPAMGADWSNWLLHMQQLERHCFAPLLAALKEGRLGQLELVLSHRDAYAQFGTSRNAQRAFWRKPTLKKLAT
ncbi:MAG: hypothetical protein V4754_02525 [Pseudomonadota bacterium]